MSRAKYDADYNQIVYPFTIEEINLFYKLVVTATEASPNFSEQKELHKVLANLEECREVYEKEYTTF